MGFEFPARRRVVQAMNGRGTRWLHVVDGDCVVRSREGAERGKAFEDFRIAVGVGILGKHEAQK